MLLELVIATTLIGNCDNCVWTSTAQSGPIAECSANGETWREQGLVCHANKFERRLIGTIQGVASSFTSASPMPKCDDGETLVTFPGTNIPMCASSLKPPRK